MLRIQVCYNIWLRGCSCLEGLLPQKLKCVLARTEDFSQSEKLDHAAACPLMTFTAGQLSPSLRWTQWRNLNFGVLTGGGGGAALDG